MINPNNPAQLARLQQSIEHSRRVLEPWRDYREAFVKEYVGSRYSDNGPKYKKLVNLMNQTAETYTVQLVANRPRVLISSRYRDLQYFSQKYQIHINNLIEEIHLEQTLREVVLDAFFSIGIVKTFLGSTGDKVEVPNPEYDEYYGNPENPIPETLWVDPGKPTVERISLDDWFHDTTATRWDKIKFSGDYYRISYDKLKDPMFDQSVASRLRPTKRYDQFSDDEGYERVSDITRNEQAEWDEMVDMIDLCDVWLPYEKLVVTMPRQSFRDSRPLAVREWDGPENGPYRILGYMPVPDNLMPSSPAQNIQDLEGLFNSLLRKLERQAKRQKKLVGAPEGAKRDLDRAKRHSDGDSVYLSNPESIKEFSLGGIDQGNMAFAIQIGQLYNKAAGNPEAMAGLGPQSSTASQDAMIQDAVSKKLAKMQEQVVGFTEGVCRDLAWMLWVDAYKEQPAMFEIPDAGISVQSNWSPEDREGDFQQYLLNVDPYSMAYKSPSQRANQLREILQTLYMPAMDAIREQGGTIDWQEVTEIFSELYDLPRLKNLIKFNQPPMEQRPDHREAMKTSSSNESKEYVRRNISTGGTPESKENVMMQTLLAGGDAPINQDQMGDM